MITLTQIRDYVELKLQEAAEALSLDEKVSFSVELDVFDYTWLLRNADNNMVTTPCVLELMSSDFSSGTDLVQKEYVFTLRLLVKEYLRADLRAIMEEYMEQENANGAAMNIGSTFIQKYTPQFTMSVIEEVGGEDINLGEGEGSGSHMTIDVEFTWLATDSVLTSENLILKVDGVEVPFTELSFGTNKGLVMGMQANDIVSKQNAINTNIMQVEFIFDPQNTAIRGLYEEIIGTNIDKVNNEHQISLQLTDTGVSSDVAATFEAEHTYTMRLGTGATAITKPTLLSLTCEFVSAYAKLSLAIDNIAMPVMSHRVEYNTITDDVQMVPSDITKGYPTGFTRAFSFQIVVDVNNSIVTRLITQAMSPTIDGSTYTLTLTLGTILLGTYECVVGSIVFEGSLTPMGLMSVSFKERL